MSLPSRDRDHIWQDLRRDIQTVVLLARIRLGQRYVGSWLGIAWSLVHPFSYILILWFILTNIFVNPIQNYIVFLVAGILPWFFLSNALSTSVNSLAGRRGVLEASTVAPAVFICSDVTVELFGFGIALATALVVVHIVWMPLAWTLLFLPVALAPLLIFCFASAVALALIGARFRDTAHLLQVFLSVMFWLLPISYHWSSLPRLAGAVVKYNPFSLLISPIQIVVHGQDIPSAPLMLSGYAVAAVATMIAVAVYRRLQPSIIFYL